MEKRAYYQWAERLFILFLFCAALFLFLSNLGNQYLWQDEAQTALLSRAVIKYGLPIGCDGKNFFSQELGAEYGKKYVWKWHGWLQFYVLAAFFRLFGESNFVARLPFAIFGIATVFLTYAFCKALWRNRSVGAVAAVFLLTSVPFQLLSRQCRYYSMVACLSLLALFSYVRFLEAKRFSAVTFVISSVLVFHSNYMYFAPLLAAVVLHALLFHRRRVRTLLFLVCLTVLINLPWIVWFSTMRYDQIYGDRMFAPNRLLFICKTYLSQIRRYVLPPYLLLIALLAAIGSLVTTGRLVSQSRIFWQKVVLLLFFVVFSLVVVIFTSSGPFLRFLTPLIPVFQIIAALLVVALARIHIVVPVAIVIVLVSAGPIREFLYEITHNYDGPIEGIVKYLNENGSDDNVVAITYGDLPLKFYTKMRIVGGLTGEDLSPAGKAEWVIIRKHIICKKDYKVKQYLLENLPLKNYERVILDYPDTPFENRENPDEHHFRTVKNEDKVVILKKIR